ncbi:MAG: hypothetical protein E7211_10235 [Clostridium lundense]|nr:hypothetical protein [Clostridium lundense]
MYDLSKVDLGEDEAEQDERLKEYFLKTQSYINAFNGTKTIVIGRKGSGKSAIFTLLRYELEESDALVVQITPDQYSWSALKDYEEQGILPEQAHTNAWKLTILYSIIWKLNDQGLISDRSELCKYVKYMRDSFTPNIDSWFFNITKKAKEALSSFETQWVSIKDNKIMTPLKIIEEIKAILINEWPQHIKIRVLIDRLDDSWDASKSSENLIIGLLKATTYINSQLKNKVITTVFIRSDIYDNLFFDDQDKLRQFEETLFWNTTDLKSVVSERVKVSLNLNNINNEEIWKGLFSNKLYRSKASAEKYIIDRTFKRPRDIISFVRMALEESVKAGYGSCIEPTDTRIAEEERYSQSKYKDLIIEYRKQIPYIKDLLDSFSGHIHKLSKEELLAHLDTFTESNSIKKQSVQILRELFTMGFIGIKRKGRAGVKQRGGEFFYYYYDDQSLNPLNFDTFYIHPALRHYLNITENRSKS